MKHQDVVINGQLGDAVRADGGCGVGFGDRRRLGRAVDRAPGGDEQQAADPHSHRLLQQPDAAGQVGKQVKTGSPLLVLGKVAQARSMTSQPGSRIFRIWARLPSSAQR